MFQLQSKQGVEFCDGLTRRDFLRVGTLGAGAIGLSLADLQQVTASTADRDINCILLFLVGGPSQLDTWDLKPDAPDTIRGPFRPIRTNVPGIALGEHFPRMAQMADRYALLRSVHHSAAPIHETGHQMMQTGSLCRNGLAHPHYGSVLSYLRGPRPAAPPAFVVLPTPIGNTGVSVSHGQDAGFLGSQHGPFVAATDLAAVDGLDPARLPNPRALLDAVDGVHRSVDVALGSQDGPAERALTQILSPRAKKAFNLTGEPESLRDSYGRNTFGQSCLLARRLVEHGSRLVTVNMFDSVFNRITWDCHADGGALPATLADYKQTLCPMFDFAYTALLDDLRQRGLLDNTLVVAMGEFGRTPQLNPRGGRDHWPAVWSVLFAGAGVRGGQVIGASDDNGAEPRDRPVTPDMLAASIYTALGIDLNTRLPGPDNQQLPLCTAQPVYELFHAGTKQRPVPDAL